jgi:hypothetical protein
VVEGRLELFAASAPTAATAAATSFRAVAGGGAALGTLAGLLVAVLVLVEILDVVLLGGRGLDLRFDLVAQVAFAGAGVLVVGGKVVLLAELAQLGGADLQLVRDPGVGAPLAHPGADLVELRLQ